jgi:hypothetical protein
VEIAQDYQCTLENSLTTIIFTSTNEVEKIIEAPAMIPERTPERVYSEDWEIDQRLVAFGVTRAELIEVARGVVAGRADATENDPASAGGQFAYIFGTRYLRSLFRTKKWVLHRQENIEAVKHPDRDSRIIYQSVDIAASKVYEPRAISGKGNGADRIIDSAQGSLFPAEMMKDLSSFGIHVLNTGVWFYCVSVNGDDVRAELSLPKSIDGKNFHGFLERIFIIREGEWTALSPGSDVRDDAIDFEPIVTRK